MANTNNERKVVKTRIQNKHEPEVNWKKATNFSPLPGELIVYDTDANHDYQRIKIGDSNGTNVNSLPFLNEVIPTSEIEDICI